jgi:hypothetical protein
MPRDDGARTTYTKSIELLKRMPGTLTPTDAIEALTEARERTLTLVAAIGDEDLERVHSTLMSPLVWDLGHIAAFEDLWLVHRLGGEPMLRSDLASCRSCGPRRHANISTSSASVPSPHSSARASAID